VKTVLIYKDELLPISETFIQAQVSALKRYRAQYVGVFRSKQSLSILDDAIIAVPRASEQIERICRAVYYRTGLAPGFFKAVRETQPSVIHAHFAPSGKNALRLAKVLNVPLIVTLHGYDVTAKQDYRRLYSELWGNASTFLCVSEFIRTKAIEAGFPPHKLRVLYNGIDTETFAYTNRERETNLILFVGRLVEKKGCAYLLRSMVKVKESCPSAHLVVIGDGPQRSQLQSEAEALGVPCEFLGGRPLEFVRSYQRKASIVCVPSVTAQDGDSEGLPTVILEAMAAGATVVGTWHAGIPEVIDNGRTGLLAPERDPELLATALIRALKDSDFRAKCQGVGQELIRDKFDIRRQAMALEDIYDEIQKAPFEPMRGNRHSEVLPVAMRSGPQSKAEQPRSLNR